MRSKPFSHGIAREQELSRVNMGKWHHRSQVGRQCHYNISRTEHGHCE